MNTSFCARWLVAALVLPSVLWSQTVCVGTEAECRAAQEKLCQEEPTPSNLIIAKPVKLSGVLLDETGASIDFDRVAQDSMTIIQIRNEKTDAIVFAVPLRDHGQFEFEWVPAGSHRLIAVWMKNGRLRRLPLADQPKPMSCSEAGPCSVKAVIHSHGTDNPIDSCPPK
jgi:hypothetical protein